MKKNISTAKMPIRTQVTIPGSKGMTYRALLLSALAEGVSEISGMLVNDDTRAFVTALEQLGIMMQLDAMDRSCIVGGGSGQFPRKDTSIWCESSGSIERFLLAACAVTPGKFFFDGEKSLHQHPVEPLLKVLRSQGAKTIPKEATQLPLTLNGTDVLAGGEIEVDASETGQFISALLMVAPFAKSSVEIKSPSIVNRPYVDMTCAMMAEFGVLVHRLHHARFVIPVPQRYKAVDYQVEPDLSIACYFFAAAAVTGGEVTIQAFDRENSKQGDVKFLLILEKMGCEIIETLMGFTVKGPAELHGVNADMRDFSDVFMTLAAVAPFAKTPTTITNISESGVQEFNRINVMRRELEKLQVKVEEGPDWLRIYPSEPQGGVIDSRNDHRIAMAFAIIGLRVPGVEIHGADCVGKVCPEFFGLWEGLLA